MPTYSIIYKIDKKPLGIGGAARVYGCTRIADGERFAIKILSDKNDKGKVDRFKREIDAIINIVNYGIDGVLPILDYDKENLWYVMPLANSLRSIIENYAKSQQTAIPVTTYRDEILQKNVEGFIMLAATLEKIHALGYVHRDIKPDNLYEWNGIYCIGDFGIVDMPTNKALTKKQDRLGAWNTIAPEVLRDSRTATSWSLFTISSAYSLSDILICG
jgi:serine/threonine protein kinase